MSTGNELSTKFVKAHVVNQSISTTNAMRWLHKLMYEFWGFCVNGDNDLTVPRGFAPVSGVLFPPLWQSGTAVLLTSGSDGETTDGMPFFTSNSTDWYSGSMLNKWLVTWKSGSSSTDDSIYPITQIINSSTIRIDTNVGGTPYTASMRPSMTSRTNINFRVVDFNASIGLSGFTTDNDGLVLCFSGAYLVNSGQINPQCRTTIKTSVGTYVPQVGLTLSSSGSWTPASSSGYFTDGTSEIVSTSMTNWFNSTSGQGVITLIGAQDFLICHLRGTNAWNSIGSGFHIEIPQRLYQRDYDPNPIVAMNWGIMTPAINNSLHNYGGGFTAHNPPDNTTRKWKSMIRSLAGDSFNSTFYASSAPYNVVNGRLNEAYFNIYRNKFVINDFALGNDFGIDSGGFVSMRFKLRRARWVANIIPSFQRLGDHGEWIHIGNGILWPWDGSVLPYNLFKAGA